jgi:hypothetical protein
MAAPDEARALRILELDAAATPDDIHRSYHLLKRLHGRTGAMFAAPGMDEFSSEARQEVLAQIEAAYALLTARGQGMAAGAPGAPGAAPRPEAPAEVPATALRRARDAAGLSLDQVAEETHVRMEYLIALEEERFDHLRLATVNVRGYLTAFANAVSLPAEEVVPAFMQKFLAWQAQHNP